MDTSNNLAARLRHNARTPLNAILGMVELLEGTSLDDAQRQYVNILRRSTETLLGVVDELPEAHEVAASQLPDIAGLRILLVDDSEDNRFLIVRYLKGSGAVVEEASDGAEGLLKFQAGRFDAVLMDVEMPVMNGFAASRAMRDWERDQRHPPSRIIALTAHDPVEALRESQAAGCDELVTKPIRKATLLATLASHHTGVEDLVPAYLAKRRADIPKLRAALADGDFETIRGLAHKLAGTGAGYGLPHVSRIGRELERAARDSQANETSSLIGALETAVNQIS